MRWFFIVVSIVLFSAPALALEYNIESRLDSNAYLYFDSDDKSKSVFSEVEYTAINTIEEGNFLALIELKFGADNAGIYDGIIGDNSDQRKYLHLGEAYLEYSNGKFSSRIGNQVFNHALLEEVSPSDILAQRDWNHLVDNERLEVPAIDLKFGYEEFVEFVYIPYFMPSLLPGTNNPWQRSYGLEIAEQEMPDRNEGSFLVRAGSSLFDTDIVFSAYHGYSYSPAYKIGQDASSNLVIIPWYNKQSVLAVSASRFVGEYTVNAEIAYYDQKSRDDFIQYGLSVSRLWGSLYTMIQYTDEIVCNEGLADDFDLRRQLQGIQAKLSYSFGDFEEWELALEGAINIDDGDALLKSALKYRGEDWYAELGIVSLSGSNDTFFGGYSDNDYIYLGLTFNF